MRYWWSVSGDYEPLNDFDFDIVARVDINIIFKYYYYYY